MAPRDIAQVPYADHQALSLLLQQGVIGWTAQTTQSYLQYQSTHQLGEIIRSIVGKNYKTKPPVPFAELFPATDELMRFGIVKNELPVGTQMVAALSKHMPDHIKEKLGVRS